MERSLVLFDVAERVAVLTLNYPEKRNALSRAMLTALGEHLDRVAANPDVRVVVLQAAGPVFSAGHDLRELTAAPPEEHASLFSLCTSVMEKIRRLPQPVIAAVDGLATAAGCQLAATCDLVVASDRARFATPGVQIGLFCSTPAVALCRAVPAKKAMEMLLTGEPIDAREAERVGLVNRVVPPARLADEALKLAKKVAEVSGPIVALGKRAFYEQLPLDRPTAYALAEQYMVKNAALDEAQEGIEAFLAKRPPRWRRE